MGFMDTIREALAAPYVATQRAEWVGYESPYASPNHLVTIEAPTDRPVRVDRAAAMTVPAVARARRLIVGSIARCPLEARTGGERAVDQPLWINRTDGMQSPTFRMSWTVDDLFFYGWSLWSLQRGTDGKVTHAARVPYHLWDWDQDGAIQVQGQYPNPDEVCLIPGIDEGLLSTSTASIRHAIDLQRLAQRAAENPAAQIALKQVAGQPLNKEQIRTLIDGWADARRGKNGGVAYLNQSIDLQELGKTDAQMMIDARNTAAVDIARATGIPASMIDAGTSATGELTYRNQTARNVELVDYALAPHMAAISARLGLDDMVPRGWAVAFNLQDLTGPTIGDLDAPDDDQQTYDEPTPEPAKETAP